MKTLFLQTVVHEARALSSLDSHEFLLLMSRSKFRPPIPFVRDSAIPSTEAGDLLLKKIPTSNFRSLKSLEI